MNEAFRLSAQGGFTAFCEWVKSSSCPRGTEGKITQHSKSASEAR